MHLLRHALQALMVLLTITSARAQTSQQPIRIVFPSPAGGAGDTLVRMLAESMQSSLGRPVIVENKAGAGGRIGVLAVKEAPADGSVLLVTPVGPMAVFPHVYEKLGYDPVIDFKPISQIATFDLGARRIRPATSKYLRRRALRVHASSATCQLFARQVTQSKQPYGLASTRPGGRRPK
jgi:tripartite-type tricarboxylate transporter receptor subunit TctC